MGQTCWSKHGTELGMEYRARICGAYPHFMSFRPEWIALIFERIPTELVLQLKWMILLFYQFQDAPKKETTGPISWCARSEHLRNPTFYQESWVAQRKTGAFCKGIPASNMKRFTRHQGKSSDLPPVHCINRWASAKTTIPGPTEISMESVIDKYVRTGVKRNKED